MKTGIKFGALIGLSYFIIFTINYYLDINAGPLVAILTFCVIIALFVLGLLEMKKKKYNNNINYAQSLYNGLYIVVFSAIFTTMANWVFLSQIDTTYKERALTQTRENMLKEKKSAVEISNEIAKVEKEQDLKQIVSGTLLSIAIFTMIVNTVAGAFVRNQDTFNKIPNQ